MRDFRRLQTDAPPGITAAPEEDNILVWHAAIFGPEDTPWENGTFKLKVVFSEEYPAKAPEVKFITPMFHPNVYANGNICLDILQSQWTPIYDISSILTSIQSLLMDPNPNSPANAEAARLYQSNRREYNRRVQECVEKSWQLIDSEDDSDEEETNTDESKAATATSLTEAPAVGMEQQASASGSAPSSGAEATTTAGGADAMTAAGTSQE